MVTAVHSAEEEYIWKHGKDLLQNAQALVPALKGAALDKVTPMQHNFTDNRNPDPDADQKVTTAPRPIPIDGLPVLGPVQSGFYAAVSHSGLTIAPVVGKIVADQVAVNLGLRGPPCNADPSPPFAPGRFNRVQSRL